VILLFLPAGTTLTQQDGTQTLTSCTDFGGYHKSVAVGPNGASVVYAVVPRCADAGALSGLEAVTGPASHELAEAVTDPLAGSTRPSDAAYQRVDDAHVIWSLVLGGGEIGDLCAAFQDAYVHPSEPELTGYLVQRVWSNRAASEGRDPCVPAPPSTTTPDYVNAVPVLQPVLVDVGGRTFSTLGLPVRVGASVDLELDLFGNAPPGGPAWQVEAIAPSAPDGGAPELTFSPPSVTGSNGSRLKMTVRRPHNDGASLHPFLLVSHLGSRRTVWIGLATN
jgi:hypothetical protein